MLNSCMNDLLKLQEAVVKLHELAREVSSPRIALHLRQTADSLAAFCKELRAQAR